MTQFEIKTEIIKETVTIRKAIMDIDSCFEANGKVPEYLFSVLKSSNDRVLELANKIGN